MSARACPAVITPDPTEDCTAAQPASRRIDCVEVGALKVFDQAEHELLVIARVAAHDRGHRVESGEPRRAPSPFTGDQLVAVGQAPHEKGLEDAVEADGLRELAERLSVES